MTAAQTTTTFEFIHISSIHESPRNPRKHFDQAKLEELARSIGEHGVLTPLLARPVHDRGVPGGASHPVDRYELAAGHRRFRASKLAGVSNLPVVVREMTDLQLLEVLTIENLQRDDVHELEEAQGFADLMKDAGYTVERIAERIGKSVKYVYDRVKLLQLSPSLQQVFFEKKITAGHAIILARLTPEHQKRAADYQHGGLWQHDDNWQIDLGDPQHEIKGFGAVQPKSVRELQHWVDTHVRIDVARDADVQLFPELVAVAAPALEQREKVVAITHHLFVHPDAKVDGERTYGPATWKRADGKEKSKPCERSVIGVVVAGEERGASFRVCVDKMKCKTHWGAEIAERERRAKAATTPASASAASAKQPPARSSWEVEEEARKQKQLAFEPIAIALVPALAAHIKKAPAGGRSLIAELVLTNNNEPSKKAAALVGRGSSAEDLLRYVAFGVIESMAQRRYRAHEDLPKLCKALGFDYPKFVKSLAPAPAKKPAAKKARR